MLAIVRQCGLDAIQLSGDEASEVAGQLPGIALFKAIRLDGAPSEAGWLDANQAPDVRLLVDAHVPGSYGGAGVLADWGRAAELARRRSIVLAGGLTPENVGAAIRQVRPWGVDVSSGVETERRQGCRQDSGVCRRSARGRSAARERADTSTVMRFLKAALRLPLITLTIVYCIRWAAIRLRRIWLRSTDNSTPPIEPEQVDPQMRRVIISDLHMGAGDRLDDFDADAELSTFIRTYVAGAAPTELILAGDTFEFLQVRLPDLSDFEWSGEAAAQRLGAILAAHTEPIAALRVFLDQPGNQLTVLIGNHDFELHYAKAKARLREALGLAEGDRRLRFGLTYSGGGVYIDHGMQFDPWNRFANVA